LVSRCRHVAEEMADVALRRLQFGHALARASALPPVIPASA
jgi:hypothetical protein